MAVAAVLAAPQVAAPQAWSLYFEADEYSYDDRRAQLIREMTAHFGCQSARQSLLSRTSCPQEGTCIVSLSTDQLLKESSSGDLEAAIDCQPLEAIDCIAVAASEVNCESTGFQTLCTT